MLNAAIMIGGTINMMGMMLMPTEAAELESLLKAELDDLLGELDRKWDNEVLKQALEERYQILSGILNRIASEGDKYKYQIGIKKIEIKNEKKH